MRKINNTVIALSRQLENLNAGGGVELVRACRLLLLFVIRYKSHGFSKSERGKTLNK